MLHVSTMNGIDKGRQACMVRSSSKIKWVCIRPIIHCYTAGFLQQFAELLSGLPAKTTNTMLHFYRQIHSVN